jgi:hypothetical protein
MGRERGVGKGAAVGVKVEPEPITCFGSLAEELQSLNLGTGGSLGEWRTAVRLMRPLSRGWSLARMFFVDREGVGRTNKG